MLAGERLFGLGRFGRTGVAPATARDVSDLALHVPARIPLGDVAPPVVHLLAARERGNPDLGATAAVVEVDAQRHEGQPLPGGLALRAGRCGPDGQELAVAPRLVVEVFRARPGSDVRPDEPGFALLDVRARPGGSPGLLGCS